MKIGKMPLGAEPKRLAILGVLLAALGYLLYDNVFRSTTPAGEARTAPQPGVLRQATDLAPYTAPKVVPASPRPSTAKATRQDFRLKMERSEAAGDPAQIDPGLRLDLLAKLKTVTVGPADRSLFDFATAPPKPRLPEPPIKLAPARRRLGPEPPPPPPPPPPKPVKQPAPPLPFKFYGMLTSRSGGPKRAFLLEGEDIHTPAEGETLRKRYKVIRVGVNSVVIEDLDFKEQQSLVLTEEPGG